MGLLKNVAAKVATAAKKVDSKVSNTVNKTAAKTATTVKQTTVKVTAPIAKKIETAAVKLKTVIAKVVDKVDDVPFAILLPFKNVMVNALNVAHVAHTNDLSDVSRKFYSNIVQGSHMETADNSYFEDKNFGLEYENNFDVLTYQPSDYSIKSNSHNADDANTISTITKVGQAYAKQDVNGIIKAITDYIKRLKDKKKKGEKLTVNEEAVLSDATAAATLVVNSTDAPTEEEIANSENSVLEQIKTFVISPLGIGVIVAILAISGYFIYKKVKKGKAK